MYKCYLCTNVEHWCINVEHFFKEANALWQSEDRSRTRSFLIYSNSVRARLERPCTEGWNTPVDYLCGMWHVHRWSAFFSFNSKTCLNRVGAVKIADDICMKAYSIDFLTVENLWIWNWFAMLSVSEVHSLSNRWKVVSTGIKREHALSIPWILIGEFNSPGKEWQKISLKPRKMITSLSIEGRINGVRACLGCYKTSTRDGSKIRNFVKSRKFRSGGCGHHCPRGGDRRGERANEIRQGDLRPITPEYGIRRRKCEA